MKPLRLIFQGFNSFSERTEIDFEKLLDNGLFGIFGKTGSGKSTILDCMLYALFAKTSRIQTLREYVNNKSNSAFVDFTFEVYNQGQKNTYNVKRTIKLNKRNVPETTVTLLVKDGDGFRAIDDGDVNSRIKEIIGIGYDEFSKSIILPQNEFAAFVKSTKTVRLQLVSKLFSLEKYDTLLLKALKSRINSFNNVLAGIDGELKQYELLTDEYLSALVENKSKQVWLRDRLTAQVLSLRNTVDTMAPLYAVKERYDDVCSKLAKLEEEKDDVEKKRYKLNRREAALVVDNAVKRCDGLINDRNGTSILLQEVEAKQVKIKAELSELERQNIDGLNARLVSATYNVGLLEAKADLVSRIEALRASLQKIRADKFLLENKIDKLSCDKGDFLLKIEEIGDPSASLSELIDQVGAQALVNELIDEVTFLEDLLGKINSLNCNIDSKIKLSVNERIELVKDRMVGLDGVKVSADEISLRIEEIRESTKRLNEYRERLSACVSQLAVAKEQFKTCCEQEEKISKEGADLRDQLNALSAEVGFDVSTSSKYNAALVKIKGDCSLLSKKIDVLTSSVNKCREDLLLLNADHAKAVAELEIKSKEADAAILDLNEKLLFFGFKNKEEVFDYALDGETYSLYNQIVASFDESLGLNSALKRSLKDELDASGFDVDAYFNIRAQLSTAEAELKTAESSLLITTHELDDANKKLSEMKDVLKRRSDVYSRLSLCEKLEKVLSNHNLLNFIAEEYLSDICLSASRTLLMLTGGRYDLVYDGEFFVLDNMNCGDRRSVSTLSGGETFLVSLSLALSLSQAICEKTRSPIEFFFLDEGFGTLDADLTEVVLDSLYKLKSANFTIGLISHVPELKQRISSKIIVTPATATEGSKVEVVC